MDVLIPEEKLMLSGKLSDCNSFAEIFHNREKQKHNLLPQTDPEVDPKVALDFAIF